MHSVLGQNVQPPHVTQMDARISPGYRPTNAGKWTHIAKKNGHVKSIGLQGAPLGPAPNNKLLTTSFGIRLYDCVIYSTLALFQQLNLYPDAWLRRQRIGKTAELYTVFVKYTVQISFTVFTWGTSFKWATNSWFKILIHSIFYEPLHISFNITEPLHFKQRVLIYKQNVHPLKLKNSV